MADTLWYAGLEKQATRMATINIYIIADGSNTKRFWWKITYLRLSYSKCHITQWDQWCALSSFYPCYYYLSCEFSSLTIMLPFYCHASMNCIIQKLIVCIFLVLMNRMALRLPSVWGMLFLSNYKFSMVNTTYSTPISNTLIATYIHTLSMLAVTIIENSFKRENASWAAMGKFCGFILISATLGHIPTLHGLAK